MKHIVVAIYSFYPFSIGGRETWLSEITRFLSNKEYKLTVYTLLHANKKGSYETYQHEKMKIIPIPTIQTILSKSKMLLKLRGMPFIKYFMYLDFYIFSFFIKNHLLKTYKETNMIFLAPNLGFECFPWISIKNDNSSIPLIVLAMGEWLKDVSVSFPALKNKLKLIEKQTALSADIIVFSSPTQLEKECSRLEVDKRKTLVMHFSTLDTELFRLPKDNEKEKIRHQLKIEDGTVVLLNVGTLREIKGQSVLIEALQKIENKERCRLFLVGENSGEYYEKITSSLNNSINITYLGPQSREQVAKIMKASDVFILPSLSEVQPFVVVEALACGLPLVVTDVGMVRDIIQDTGIVVKPGDEDSLARGISSMLKDLGKYQQNAIIAAKGFNQKYSSQNSAEQLSQILENLNANELS